MKIQSVKCEIWKALALLSMALIVSGCPPKTPTGPTENPLTFSGASSPGDNTIYMAYNRALSSGNILAIDVKVNNISTPVYGAAFDVEFDSSKAAYDSLLPGIFLEDGGNTVNYNLDLQSDNNNKFVVGISRQGNVNGVTGSGIIVTLKFNVTGETYVRFVRNSSNLLEKISATQTQPIPGITWSDGTVTVQ